MSEEILIALKEIHARYCIPASEKNYTDKDYACMQYEKLVIHLQQEIDRLNNIINEFEDWLGKQRIRNSEWDNFVIKDTRLGIPITYLLDKLKELKDSD